MRTQFGEVYAESVAKDQVLAALGGRTVSQALADGTDAKIVWRAVCEAFNVPESRRRGRRPAQRRANAISGRRSPSLSAARSAEM